MGCLILNPDRFYCSFIGREGGFCCSLIGEAFNLIPKPAPTND
ncbi:hypothetical protein MC7420_1656 [Coleofasciculus chthonoplastes PCC 7420]|uniref:Uncharacterized protein n=1 Tax=Coleofasciculus chthonoplastes PCC 7420 TaxID=118168 RepID=B4VMX0_9CYAN|nr:hypothetical protein MC7420_1656 [Coleofasciculus chthonoplastes PCC 7420]